MAELREAYASGNLVVFAGGGISTAAGLPSWGGLAELLTRHPRMVQDKVRSDELLAHLQNLQIVDALTVAEQVLGRPEFGVFVEHMLNDQDQSLPEVARAVAALAPRLRAVLTTNIDHLLERAFAGKWPSLWKAPSGLIQRRRFILKLHGTLLDRDSWVFTRDDYDQATWGNGNIRETLSLFFHAFPLLFVGYDFEGDDFDTVLAQVRALAGSQPPRHYALVPRDSLPSVRREGLERAGIRFIEYDNSDKQHTDATRLLEALAASLPLEQPQSSPASPTSASQPGRSPFPGLESFDESRSELFHGRETEVSEALQSLGMTSRGPVRWLQVEGASGTGKSSFARAGLVPKVRLGWVEGGPLEWHVAVLRPGRQPLLSLAQSLHATFRPVGASLDGLVQEFHHSDSALASFLRQYMLPGHGFLLLVDQFEELFTLADADVARVFDRLLAAALEDTDGPLYLVTTIRSDFLGSLDTLPGLKRLLPCLASRYTLRPMGPLGLQAAIKRPAEMAGLRWEAGLPEMLLQDVSGLEAGLPLLAHALWELWARRCGNTLTCEAYQEMGGILGALTRSANALVNQLEAQGSRRVRDLLLALVTLLGGKISRRSLTCAEALESAGGDEEARNVLARLSGGRGPTQPETAPPPVRLLVVTQSEAQDRVDLVHEALLSRWVTLGEWIKEERRLLARRDDLEAAARSWRAAGHPREDLPSGVQLAYLRTASPITALAKEFLRRAEAREKSRKRTMKGLLAYLIVGQLGLLVALSFLSYLWPRKETLSTLSEERLSAAIALAHRIAFEIDPMLESHPAAEGARTELLESASKMLDGLGSDAQELGTVRLRLHHLRGGLAISQNDLLRAQQEYERGLELARRFSEEAPDSSIARQALFASLQELGAVAWTVGHLDVALTHFQEAFEIARALSDTEPSNTTLAYNHARTLGRLEGPFNTEFKLARARAELLATRVADGARDSDASRVHRTNATRLLNELQRQGLANHPSYQALRAMLAEPPR